MTSTGVGGTGGKKNGPRTGANAGDTGGRKWREDGGDAMRLVVKAHMEKEDRTKGAIICLSTVSFFFLLTFLNM